MEYTLAAMLNKCMFFIIFLLPIKGILRSKEPSKKRNGKLIRFSSFYVLLYFIKMKERCMSMDFEASAMSLFSLGKNINSVL